MTSRSSHSSCAWCDPSVILRHRFAAPAIGVLGIFPFLGISTHGQQSKPPVSQPFSYSASLSVKEAYDSDVFMQSVTPLANQSSMVTTVTPSVGLAYKPSSAFNLSLAYSPETVFYHSESAEDYVVHKGILGATGKKGDFTWDIGNALTFIDGNESSPIFSGPGGAPALGGVPLRDRREALVYRGAFKSQITVAENWFVRPVTSAYVHDFYTLQKTNPPGSVYQNYADRNDFNGGLDIGFKVAKELYLTAGYRYGVQDQGGLLGSPFQYDNTYHRVLFGIEGKPFDWLKLALVAGPDIRSFASSTPASFDRDHTHLFIDGSVTLTPTKRDTVAATAKRFEQLGYGGASVYDDTVYDITWKRKIDDHWSCGLGFKALNWDFSAPVNRGEWWLGPSAQVTYTFSKSFAAEAAYGYDRVRSDVPKTQGREAERHITSLGLRYTF